MESLLRDVRFGLKLLLRDRVYGLTVLSTLAVCIGANVALFSVVHSVLLKPLSYPSSDRLVHVYNSYPEAGVERASNGTVDYFQRRKGVAAFQDVAISQGWGGTVGEAGQVERVRAMRVTPSYFHLLGARAALGRTFTADETDPDRDRVVVLTHAYWEQRFGGDRSAVGSDLRIDGRPYTIVGVLADDFRVVGREDTRFFVPIPLPPDAADLQNWHSNSFQMVARLRPGATIEQARAQNDALNQRLINEWPVPNGRQILKDAGFHTVVIGARDDVVRDVRSTLYLLWGGVAFVLLIGCVNIANLVLARAYRRSGELATRMALGAERGRLARQILSEAAVTAVLGGMLGLGVGALGLKLVGSLGMQSLPRGSDVSLDGTVVLFTLGLSLAAAVLFGALPVAHVFRSDLGGVFRSESRTGTASRRAMLLRGLLVTGQVALAFVLLSGAGLLFRSFQAASRVDPGFQPDGVLTGAVTLPTARYPDGASRRRFASELLDRIRALPGVESAGATSMIPFGGNNSSSVIWPEGYTPRPGESLIAPYASFVAPDYFEAMGIPVREGRAFDDRDGPDAPNSIVIDELLARRYWPDSSPLGHKMVWGTTPNGDAQVPDSSLYTIVGVVGAIQQNDLTATGQVGAYYFPYLHRAPNSGMMLVVKTSGDATASTPAVRSALSDLDPELPLFDVESMGARIEDSLRARRSSMVLLSIFSGVALFLAVVGLYGVLAHAVAQRTREIGIRMAMGGAPSDVFRMVVVQGARVVLVGLLLGVGGSFALVRVVRSVLFGVGPSDPTVLVVSAAALAVVGLVACVIPALRATRVDPTEALAGG